MVWQMRGSVVAVTGSASGIGKELSRLLALEEAANVAMLDIDQVDKANQPSSIVIGGILGQTANEDAAEAMKKAGGVVLPLNVNVRKESSVQAAFSTIAQHPNFGTIIAHGAVYLEKRMGIGGLPDVVVCCAGVFGTSAFDELDEESDLRRSLDINVLGVYRCIKAVLGAMEERGSGHIVVTASMASFMAFPQFSAYAYSNAKFHVLCTIDKGSRKTTRIHFRVPSCCKLLS